MYGANIRVSHGTLFFDELYGVISHPTLATTRRGHKQHGSSGVLDRHKKSSSFPTGAQSMAEKTTPLANNSPAS